jgi:hypothetical protein
MVDECSDTRIHGLRAVSGVAGTGDGRGYLLGWKAIPFAREDLDSNYVALAERRSALGGATCLGQHGRGRRHGGIVGEAAASVARGAASMHRSRVYRQVEYEETRKKHGVGYCFGTAASAACYSGQSSM